MVSGAFWKGDSVLLMDLVSRFCLHGLFSPSGHISLGHQGSASCRDPSVYQHWEQPPWDEPFQGHWTCCLCGRVICAPNTCEMRHGRGEKKSYF